MEKTIYQNGKVSIQASAHCEGIDYWVRFESRPIKLYRDLESALSGAANLAANVATVASLGCP